MLLMRRMTVRKFLFLAVWLQSVLHAQLKASPHIVLIVADDLGWNDVGWHNPHMYTPNLDKLAQNGVILNSSYVLPVCTPTRRLYMAAIIIGGGRTWENPRKEPPTHKKLLASFLTVIRNGQCFRPLRAPPRTRSSLLTGYYPYHVGLQMYPELIINSYHDVRFSLLKEGLTKVHAMHNVIHSSQPGHLYMNFTLLSQKLREVDYVTHMVGKWHLGFCNWNYTPTYRGFDSFLGMYSGAEDYYTHSTRYSTKSGYDFRFNKSVYDEVKGEYSANVFARRAIDIINSVDPEKESLFLYVPFQSVHEPLQVPKRYEDIYSHIQNKARRTYCGMVSALDEAVGNITDALTQRGYMDNLLLIFTTDNGGPVNHGANNWPLRGSKNTLWEGGTKGAAFVYSKTLLKKTKYVNTEMFHVVDWFPTLLSVAGGKADPGLDGIDQWPTIQSGVPSKRSTFVYNIDEIMKNAAIRVGDYKLIEGKPGTHNGWYPAPNNQRKHFSNQSTFHDIGELEYQLFNIKDDPTEHFNLVKTCPDVLKKLKVYLQEFKKTLVPAFYPHGDPKSNPKYYKGTWSPGWC